MASLTMRLHRRSKNTEALQIISPAALLLIFHSALDKYKFWKSWFSLPPAKLQKYHHMLMQDMAPAKECSALKFADNPFCSNVNIAIFVAMLLFIACIGGLVVHFLYLNYKIEMRKSRDWEQRRHLQPPYPPLQRRSQPKAVPLQPAALESSSPVWQWVLGSRQYRPLTSATPLFPPRTTIQSPLALSSSFDTSQTQNNLSNRIQRRGRSRTPRRTVMTSYGTIDEICTTEVNPCSTHPTTSLGCPSGGTIAQRRASTDGVFVMDEDL